MNNVIILHNEILSNTPDELDNIDQVKAVDEALRELGFNTEFMAFSLNLDENMKKLKGKKPCFVFDLVESIANKGSLVYIAPAILDALNIPYTGCNTEAFFCTCSKIIAKNILRMHNLKTADWITKTDSTQTGSLKNNKVIIKAVWEHASIGMDENSVINYNNEKQILEILEEKQKKYNTEFFAEKFISGREFNVSMLSRTDGGVDVLSPAEMVFSNYKDKPEIIDYKAKWDEDSINYTNTKRSFTFKEEDQNLLNEIKEICLKVWKIFGLNSYARVDFRVNEEGEIFILEVNANPCISKDSGFIAAAAHQGLTYQNVIQRIISSLINKYSI